MQAITEDLRPFLEREKIRDCIARLARGEDRRAADQISSSLWPDSTSDYGVFSGTFDAYLAWVVPGSPAIPVTQHVLGQSVIELDGGVALVETHVTAYHRINMGEAERDIIIGGRYLDRLEKRGEEWRIARRVMLYDWCQDVGPSIDWSKGLMGMPFSGAHFTGRAMGDYSEVFFPTGFSDMSSLAGKVAVVTGASRGIGKGIALALGAEGATVYVTGRTVTAGSHPLPGTVGETAAEVTRRGGKGVAVQVDHAKDEEVAALFDQVQREQGRLDILVNNAFALPEDLIEPRPFWEKPLSNWEMIDVGVRSNFVAAWHAAKVMTVQKSGLMVAISGYVGVTYTYGVVFGTCKSAVDRMARDMAVELQSHNVASLSLWQGLTFTERANRNLERNPAMKQLTVTNPAIGCTPEFPGRVIAALANDPQVMKRSGGTFITAEVAQDYGVTDADGKIIPSLRAQRGSPIWQPLVETGHGC